MTNDLDSILQIDTESAKNETRPDESTVLGGIALGITLQSLLIPMINIGATVGAKLVTPGSEAQRFGAGPMTGLIIPIAFIGITQLVYIVPAVLIARAIGHFALTRGLLIVAAVMAALNGACWFVFGAPSVPT